MSEVTESVLVEALVEALVEVLVGLVEVEVSIFEGVPVLVDPEEEVLVEDVVEEEVLVEVPVEMEDSFKTIVFEVPPNSTGESEPFPQFTTVTVTDVEVTEASFTENTIVSVPPFAETGAVKSIMANLQKPPAFASATSVVVIIA